eukprot:2019768-Rhodomonas_salina.1
MATMMMMLMMMMMIMMMMMMMMMMMTTWMRARVRVSGLLGAMTVLLPPPTPTCTMLCSALSPTSRCT